MHVPLYIRPHLVAFYFKEVEGEEIHYLNFKSKAFSLQFSSSLSQIIRILLVKADVPVKPTDLKILLTITTQRKAKKYAGKLFQIESGKNHFLKLPQEVNKMINDLLEDIFRISFVYYVIGHIENAPSPSVTTAINNFIDKYELFEFEFTQDSLRRLYYREIKKNKKLTRLGFVSSVNQRSR